MARDGDPSISYDELMRRIGLSWKIPYHRRRIGKILGQISERTNRDRQVLLSVLVQRKGPRRPGKGFVGLPLVDWGYADWRDVGLDAFVKRETERVFVAYADH